MTSSAISGERRGTVARDLVTILIRPRATIRRVLARRDRMVVPLILLVLLSGFIRDLDIAGFARATASTPVSHVALIACGVLIASGLLVLALFWLFSWVVVGVGRLLEGDGHPRGVRSALAWGLTPLAWSLAYRVPLLLAGRSGSANTIVRVSGEELVLSPAMVNGCGAALVYQLIEFAMLIWVLVITSNTLAEAHHFSPWRGLATVLITMFTPAIVILAAFLAMR